MKRRKATLDEYIELPYVVVVVPDITTDNQTCYVAYHPELEGCMSHGDSVEEALHGLREARGLYISVLLDEGLEIPVPENTAVAPSVTVNIINSEVEETKDNYFARSITIPTLQPA